MHVLLGSSICALKACLNNLHKYIMMTVQVVIVILICVKSGEWGGKCSAVGSCGREEVGSCGREVGSCAGEGGG